MSIAVVVPCYNTSSSCAGVLGEALRVTDAVLAVDDGSSDDTFDHIRASGCRWIRLERNQGKGAALRAGIAEVVKGVSGILGRDFEYLVTIDGDGQHDPADIPRIVERAREASADLVIGIRNVRLMPPKSKIGNYFSRLLFFLGTGRYVADTQSGFRLMSLPLARVLLDAVSWGRYETEAEVLSETVALGFRVATMEIQTIYFDSNRRTHFDPLWDSMRVVAVMARYALTSLAVTALDVGAFVWLVNHLGWSVVAGNIGARLSAVTAHFVLSRSYAFRAQGRLRVIELVRYGLAVTANLALTTMLIQALQKGGTDVVAAKIIAQLAGFAVSFLLLDRFVFRRGPSGKTDWDGYYRRPVGTARWSRWVMTQEILRVLAAFAPRREPLAVLEIGGGNSCFLPALINRLAINPYALLDSSQEGMRLARKRFEQHFAGRIDYLCDDVFQAHVSRRYDVVFSIGLLEHFDESQILKLVALHHQWVAPDGLVLISVPTPTVPYRITRALAEVFGLWHFPDERPIERERLIRWLADNGFQVVSDRILWAQVLTQVVVAARRSPSATA